MKKTLLLSIFIIWLILPILVDGQNNEVETGDGQENQPGNNQDNPSGNDQENPPENTEENQESEAQQKEEKKDNQQNNSINCNENRQNPQCLKEDSSKIYKEMKSNMPGNIEAIQNKSENFAEKSSTEQMTELNTQIGNFANLKNVFENGEEANKKNNRKDMVEKATEIADYLTKKECTSSSDSEYDSDFEDCRNEKKDILTQIISVVKDQFKCENILSLIEGGMSDKKEENFKYILFMIYEITSNSDSLKKGESEVLYNITLCLQEKFDEFWGEVKGELNGASSSESTIEEVKEDISLLLIKTLNNLINILHYDEIDGYLENSKNSSQSGLMMNEQGKKIQKGILDFVKQFSEFGEGNYEVSSTMNITITKFNNVEQSTTEQLNEEQTYNLTDKGIFVSFKPRGMMKGRGGKTMQFVVFESPLVSVNDTNSNSSVVRDFISLSIFDENGKEINITDLPKDSRPIILYNKTEYPNMKKCYFYNETNEDLDTDGVETENDYVEGNEKYLKCTTEHLTSFTAGYATSNTPATTTTTTTSDNKNSQTFPSIKNWWQILLMITALLY